MEPIAPGTEDEPLVSSYSSPTKQEKERERLLSLKAVLPDGKYGNVFELKYRDGAENWYCNACACPVMGWIYNHETGKRHTMFLGNSNRYSAPQEPGETLAIEVAPGEPVPPGFEGQIEKVALIQERLDVFNVGPLVALEYLLELGDYDVSKEPTYLCVLCDKKGDPRTVLTHLASYKHILQYLQKHFPTCYRALAPYMTKQYKRNWQIALHGVAEAIEKKFGRLKPMPVDADKYEKNPVHYLEMIGKGRHFSELSGFTFEDLINKEELTKVYDEENDRYGYNKGNPPQSQRKKSPSPPVVANPIKKIRISNAPAASGSTGSRRRSLSSVSSITSSDMSDFGESKNKKPPLRRSRSRSPSYRTKSRRPFIRRYSRPSPPRRDDYSRDRDRDRMRERSRNFTPSERMSFNRPRSDFVIDNRNRNKEKTEKMEEFKRLSKAIDNDMERILKNHKKNPEKHPQYNEEWKKFWNKRYKELQAEAKDVSTHDFKPEWIEFWNKRIIELHNEEIKMKKEALRKRLGMPEEPAPISFKIMPKKKGEPSKTGSNSKPLPPSALPDNDPEVIVIDDKDDDMKGSRRSHSPWEDEPMGRGLRRSRERSRDDLTAKSRENDRRGDNRSSRERQDQVSRERSNRSHHSRSPRDRLDRSPHLEGLKEKSWERDHYHPRERIRIMSELPWERSKYRGDLYKPPSVMRDVTRVPVLSPQRSSVVPEDEEDVEVNVVAVLRLLAALEEKLGSLGPKVVDLLAQALAMEKNEANSSESLLDNEINCVMFETVKEKLKGQLLAGLVEPIQEKAFKNSIKKTASLIHLAGERKKEKEKNLTRVDPVKVPGVGTVDKAAIARQIANALVLQGKTDVTQGELEQLINAVVGMAEASKSLNKPITTANFLEQIAKAGSSREKTPIKELKPLFSSVSLLEEDSRSPEKPHSMEGLSDSDLQTLLQNFKDLSTEEQHGLISYLKKLEAKEPDRVERLRKFVNLGSRISTDKQEGKKAERERGRESPFSNRLGSVNPSIEFNKRFEEAEELTVNLFEDPIVKLPIDSDEDDYTFEDVVKAASKNVKQKEMEKEREIVEESMKLDAKKGEFNLEDTKALISNIMSNINKTDVSQGNFRGLGNSHGISMTSSEFTKTLSSLPVNLDNLANIVGSVKNMTNNRTVPVLNPQEFGGFEGPQPPPSPQPQQSFTDTPSVSYGINYGQNTYSPRPNVSYPLDKTKLTYPNYPIYPPNREEFLQRPPLQPRRPSYQGNSYGNNTNRNNNYSNRW